MKEKVLTLLKNRFLFYILFIFPFILGFIGLIRLEEGSFVDCAYKMVQLYLMEYNIDSEHLNLEVQIARWMAPVMTAAVIMSVLYSFFESIQVWWKVKHQDAIAVHGDSANIDIIINKLGKRALHTKNQMVYKAKHHILIFEDDYEMYRFLDENGISLFHDSEKEIFLCSENILRGNYENNHLVICNIAENCARDYWEKNPVINKNERILLIGFENYGQRILTQAILKNVVAADSRIEYHVVGDYHSYLSKHYKIEKAVQVKLVSKDGTIRDYKEYEPICTNHDSVYFYDKEWYDIMNTAGHFDRVIIAYDVEGKNLDIFNELKTYYVNDLYHIKFSDDKIMRALWDIEKENIVPFGVNEDLFEPEIIMKEKLFYYAKMIHSRYYAQYACSGKCNGKDCQNRVNGVPRSLKKCVSCQNLLNDWNQQRTFIRYSNVAQADHISEKLRLLLGPDACVGQLGIGEKAVKAYKALKPEDKESLWKIEHIRWSRYHFMNNWDYAETRDNTLRRHHLLLPFSELPSEEKKKNEDAYLALGDLLK